MWSLKVNDQGHWKQKCKNHHFLCLSSSMVDRFTSNQEQNNHQPILQNTFHQQKCFILWHLYVCLSVTYHILEHGSKVIFFREGTLTLFNGGVTLKSKVKGQGHWERKCINHFCTYLYQKWIDLQVYPNKTKTTTSQFYTQQHLFIV